MNRRFSTALIALIAFVCASAAVAGGTPPGGRDVCVVDFTVDPSLVTADKGPLGTIGAAAGEARGAAGLQGGPLQRATGILHKAGRKKSPAELAAEVVELYGASLVKGLQERGVSGAKRCKAPTAPDGALFIQGEFLKVDEGNAVREATVGFGTGAPVIEVTGSLTDRAVVPPVLLLQFGGENKDRKLPGGTVTLNPVVMGVKYHLAKGATDKDVKKLADRMAGEIAEFIRKGLNTQYPAQ